MKKRDFETYQKHFRDFEILPKFSRPMFFKVAFATPNVQQQSAFCTDRILNYQM